MNERRIERKKERERKKEKAFLALRDLTTENICIDILIYTCVHLYIKKKQTGLFARCLQCQNMAEL